MKYCVSVSVCENEPVEVRQEELSECCISVEEQSLACINVSEGQMCKVIVSDIDEVLMWTSVICSLFEVLRAFGGGSWNDKLPWIDNDVWVNRN
jgi:hypothetical protein